MRTIEKTIYTIDELKEDIREKTIDKMTQQVHDSITENCLIDEMEQKARELLKKYFKNKAEFVRVYYDLDYSQGSGAMIEFDLSRYGETIKIRQCGNYCHERSFTIEYYTSRNDKGYEALREKIATMNKELAKFGYKWIEDTIPSKDDIIDLCNNNGYEFYEDGTMYRGG